VDRGEPLNAYFAGGVSSITSAPCAVAPRAKAAGSISPYGTGGAPKKIKDAIATADLSRILAKRFHGR